MGRGRAGGRHKTAAAAAADEGSGRHLPKPRATRRRAEELLPSLAAGLPYRPARKPLLPATCFRLDPPSPGSGREDAPSPRLLAAGPACTAQQQAAVRACATPAVRRAGHGPAGTAWTLAPGPEPPRPALHTPSRRAHDGDACRPGTPKPSRAPASLALPRPPPPRPRCAALTHLPLDRVHLPLGLHRPVHADFFPPVARHLRRACGQSTAGRQAEHGRQAGTAVERQRGHMA